MMFQSSAERAMVRDESRGRPLWHLAARRPALASAALEKLPAGCAYVCAKSESRWAVRCSEGGSRSELGGQIYPEPKRLYDFNLNKAAIGSAMSWSPDCDQFAALRSRRSRHDHVGATSNSLMRCSTVALRLRRPRIAKAAVARQRPANFWARAR